MSLVYLRDIIQTQKGYAFKSKWFIKKGIPIVKVKDFTDNSISTDNIEFISNEVASDFIKYKLHTDDIIIQTVGSWPSNPNSVVGKAVKVPNFLEGALLNQNAVKIISTEGLHNKFLFFLLRDNSFKSYIINTAQGSASQASITLESIKNYKFNLPPLQTQKKIADILSTYDDLIENNLKRIKLLEQAAQNIYKEWFVNMRFPGHENTSIDEETGLPEGWRKVALQNISTVQSSKRVFLSDYVENGIPFYRGKEITQKSRFEEISEPLFISQEKFNELEEKSGSPKKDDILITGVGTIGNCYLIKDSDLPFYFKDGNLLWLNSYKEGVSGVFLIHYLQSPVFEGVVNSICIGSSQKALTITALKKIEINLPNPEIITHFESIVSSFIKQIEVLGEATKKLKAARDILLPRLMNQTIEV